MINGHRLAWFKEMIYRLTEREHAWMAVKHLFEPSRATTLLAHRDETPGCQRRVTEARSHVRLQAIGLVCHMVNDLLKIPRTAITDEIIAHEIYAAYVEVWVRGDGCGYLRARVHVHAV